MSDFDIDGAKKAGYSDAEIADYLGKQRNFDVAGARKGGYSDADIIGHLGAQKAAGPGPDATIPRIVGQGAQGFNDAIADVMGAPVDVAAWGLRKLGVPATNPIGGSASIKKGIDYTATLPGRVSDAVSQGSVAPLTEDRTSRFEPATQGEKIASGVGQGIGNALPVLALAGLIARGAQAGSMTQRVGSALASQPVAQTVMGATGGGVTAATDSPAAGIGASLAVPVVNALARKVVTPVRTTLTPQETNILAAGDREGIPFTAAQRTGSPGLRMVEETMAKVPGGAGQMGEAFQNQRNQFNRATLERAGVTATDASPATLDHAFQQAGQTFDDLASRTVLNVDKQFVADVKQVSKDYGRRLPTDVAPVFQSYMDDLAPLLRAATTPGANPQIAGDVYATIRSDIGKRIRATNNLDLKEALGELQSTLDAAMERSTSGPLRQEWQDARREYQALKTVDKSMQGGTQTDRAAGNIPFGSLRGAVVQGDRNGYSRGRGQLNELSRVGDYIAARVPNSGTPTREAILNPLKWPMMGAMNLGARFYNSPAGRAYLTNQLADPANLPGLFGGNALQAGLAQNNEPNVPRLRGGR